MDFIMDSIHTVLDWQMAYWPWLIVSALGVGLHVGVRVYLKNQYK